MSPSRALAPLLLAAGCQAAAHTASRPPRVAVLPVRGVGLQPAESERVRVALSAAVSRVAPPIAERGDVDRLVATIGDCRQRSAPGEDRCALQVGSAARAREVVVGEVGALGKTYLVRLRLVQVEAAVTVRAIEETLFGELDVLVRATGPLADRLFGVSAPSRRRPWYSRWWIWSAVGAAIAVGIALPVALTRSREPEREQLVLP
jgi:hypothetical protein